MDKKSVVVITGASSGIGLATAKFLTNKGYTVYGLSRRIVNEGFYSLSCDITNYSAFESTVKGIYEKEGQIDVLINNAGMGISGASQNIPCENTKNLFEVNTLATINCCKVILPYLQKSKGIIINMSSIAAIIPIPFQSAYSSSKAAINLYSMALRLELAPFNVRVCAVMPGDTKTNFTQARIKTCSDDAYADSVNRSVSKMEKDEQKGKPPVSVAKVVYKLIKKKNPPALVSVGFSYKLIHLLSKILPLRLMLFIVKKLYT